MIDRDLLTEMIDFLIPRLNLEGYQTSSSVTSLTDASAQNFIDSAYLTSTLEFDLQQFSDEYELFEIVVHELAHTVLAPIQRFSQQVDLAVKDNQALRSVLKESFRQSNEESTVRVERVLVRLLWPQWEARHSPAPSRKSQKPKSQKSKPKK